VAPRSNWNPLMKDLEQLYDLWLKKAEAAADNKAWIRGVLFGVEVGSNRIAEEIAKPYPAVGAIIADWRRRLIQREETSTQEVVEGVDYGIAQVIECVRRFFESTIPHAPPRRSHMDAANGDQANEIP
jgi:hypothetical protein